MKQASMKIAMIGTRGVPANYGGFETCVEELGQRLVRMGHEVTVYCRKGYYKEQPPVYLGMSLVYLPNLKYKSLDTLSHTSLSMLHALVRPFDVLMVFNAANSPTLILPRLMRRKTAINTDGLEWKRGKWGNAAKRYYKFSEWLSTKFADRVVADSRGIQEYYRKTYGAESCFIAYGAYPGESREPDRIRQFGIERGGYFLQVTRFEPENNPLLTIQAYKRLRTDKKLVIVGASRYPGDYARKILSEAEGNSNIILPGAIYEKELLDEIWCNCFAYVHGNEVGGTNPALLQAMANGCFTLAIDVSFSRDVLGDCGLYFSKDAKSLADKMSWALYNDKSGALQGYGEMARERIKMSYSWDKVATDYEGLFRGLLKNKGSNGRIKND
ncbi:MAG TPA: glycosyl transferase [Deltaproteobacteria bacterium]|nr:MAG: hypothetical protein A2Z79_10055 [Deltaproteobacteria bacterium GWA2_55_82]OGQ63020.1 MAG: hypothetical protein A3I81_06915 [Deltaproteobacteria bacterium RIFCSPLOWO2_02_FULL_55_12]OIJ72985.1 MAG: hypothetical protein A2V21_301150 [Deltaproteobacteria bacterium GWC2_55_46]HBG46006.1 glycosyl transferase [Deltaproteobacteria bacterium]HCY11776.1 glycosyl transferase [Deltaproteobacteria bacterium]